MDRGCSEAQPGKICHTILYSHTILVLVALQEIMAALYEASGDDLPDMSLIDASPVDYGLTDGDGPQQAALLYLVCASVMAHGRQ